MRARNETVLSVVAHRILGADYQPESHYARIPVYEEDRRWYAWSDPELSRKTSASQKDNPVPGVNADIKRPAVDTEVHARFILPGTRRTVDEILDFFDGGHRAETTGDVGINQIWTAAGISFKLVAIIDHAIKSTWSYAIDSDKVKTVAQDLNTPDMVNLYFFRDIIGANGTSGFSPVPLQDTRLNTAFAAVEDWEELMYDPGLAWNITVRTAAHELGHLLKLRHHEDLTNLMYPWISEDAHTLKPLQIMIAHEHAKRYLEVSRRYSLFSREFRELYMNEKSKPSLVRAYLGERLQFDGR